MRCKNIGPFFIKGTLFPAIFQNKYDNLTATQAKKVKEWCKTWSDKYGHVGHVGYLGDWGEKQTQCEVLGTGGWCWGIMIQVEGIK